jgi:tRNA pseudouridine55 synthase
VTPAPLDGILIVDKPQGLTSHDVVARLRRLTRMKKIGHAGTLDPLATGVLVLALGKATRTLEYLTAHDKVYEAIVLLGESTDSYDAEGEVLTRHEGPLPDEQAIEAALDDFRGDIWQKPPLFSALKQGGEPLYKKARRGEQVEVEARPVTIYNLALTFWRAPDVGLYVHCSKGTYIRSLAHDLGAALGVGGHLKALRRTASGAFTLADAHDLAVLEHATAEEIAGLLLPVGAGLERIPALTVENDAIASLRHGQALPAPEGEGLRRAVDAAGRLIALLRWREGRGWQPEKVFLE